MKYGVWCEVWGGVTGRRQGWAKSMGQVILYDALDDAQTLARAYREAVGKNTVAQFSYTARQYIDEKKLS